MGPDIIYMKSSLANPKAGKSAVATSTARHAERKKNNNTIVAR